MPFKKRAIACEEERKNRFSQTSACRPRAKLVPRRVAVQTLYRKSIPRLDEEPARRRAMRSAQAVMARRRGVPVSVSTSWRAISSNLPA